MISFKAYLLAILFFFFSFSVLAQDGQKKPLMITTSFFFLYDMTHQLLSDFIEGEDYQLLLLTPEAEDPAHYLPSKQELALYQKSDLILFNGAGLESFEKKVALPQSKILYSSKGFKKEWLMNHIQAQHQHGREGKHSHGTWDAHTWMDPILAIKQIEAIYLKLQSKFSHPQQKAKLAIAFQGLSLAFQSLHQAWLSRLTPKLNADFILCSSHPAYSYLAHRYQFKIKAFDFDPSRLLQEQAQWHELKALKALAKQQGKRLLILWEKEPIQQIKEALKAEAIESIILRTLESKPVEGEYIKALQYDLHELEASISLKAEAQ